MSDRASAGSPLTCSGAMYPTVPRRVPASVAFAIVGDFVSSPAATARCFASPKSRIFARPSFVRTTFSGLRSRWTIPLSCAAARPRAICDAEVHGLSHGQSARGDPLAQRLALDELHDEDVARRGRRRRTGDFLE